MRNTSTSISVPAAALVAAVAGSSASASVAPGDEINTVRAVLSSVGQNENAVSQYFTPGQYVEHNPSSPFGLLAQRKPTHDVKVDIQVARIFADGGFVVVHSEYRGLEPRVVIDIFRLDNGRIGEHWDNTQAKCSLPNASGRTQLDGPTEVTEFERTAENKAALQAYFDDVVLGSHPEKAPQYKNVLDFKQHNCEASDLKNGVPAVKPTFTFKIQKLERILGQGNFALAVSEGVFNGAPTRFYDLYRFEDGRQVEHWDVLQSLK